MIDRTVLAPFGRASRFLVSKRELTLLKFERLKVFFNLSILTGSEPEANSYHIFSTIKTINFWRCDEIKEFD